MKTIPVSLRSRTLKSLLDQARNANIILQTPDGSEFILAEIDAFDREVQLTRQNEELMAYLDERAMQPGRIAHAEVKKLLGLK